MHTLNVKSKGRKFLVTLTGGREALDVKITSKDVEAFGVFFAGILDLGDDADKISAEVYEQINDSIEAWLARRAERFA